MQEINPNMFFSLSEAIRNSLEYLLNSGKPIDNKYWQAQKIEKDEFKSFEVQDIVFSAPIPDSIEDLRSQCSPNVKWADEQFDERVSGIPLNPMPSYVRWPFWRPNQSNFSIEIDGEKFSHTYAERFWPKYTDDKTVRSGIRFPYGDLNDVVDLLKKDPYTRQAYLTIWHPEDTGDAHGKRVPCTLGYHFMMRDNKLNVFYIIRSCDAVRYLRDDIYMACRLNQWMLEKLRGIDNFWNDVSIGNLTFHCFSLHMFKGDIQILKLREKI